MAHFAQIDENNTVIQVLVVSNDDILDSNGIENEEIGKQFIASLGLQGTWVQTSYNHNFRKQFAGPGYTFDSDNNIFIAPSPFDSWLLDENGDWQAPTPKPDDGNEYEWNEELLEWEQLGKVGDTTVEVLGE